MFLIDRERFPVRSPVGLYFVVLEFNAFPLLLCAQGSAHMREWSHLDLREPKEVALLYGELHEFYLELNTVQVQRDLFHQHEQKIHRVDEPLRGPQRERPRFVRVSFPQR